MRTNARQRELFAVCRSPSFFFPKRKEGKYFENQPPPQSRGERRKKLERSSKSPASFRASGDAAGRTQDPERQSRRRGRFITPGAAGGCSGAIPARVRLFGPTEERSSLGCLPADG